MFRLTQNNLTALTVPIDILNTDRSGLSEVSVAAGQLLIAFIAPPWGDALNKTTGLDLRHTKPPITEIVDFLLHAFAHTRLLCAIQIHETVNTEALAELTSRFDWSASRVYDLNAAGENHGVLHGARGSTPAKDPQHVAPGNRRRPGAGKTTVLLAQQARTSRAGGRAPR